MEKLKKYKFEVQGLVKVEMEAVDEEEARYKMIIQLEDGMYDEELRQSSVVSNCGEVKDG